MREEVIADGPQEKREGEKVLNDRQQRELTDLMRKMKGTYLQLLQLLYELRIPFKA